VERRAPGLQIVIIQNDGSQRVAEQPPMPMLGVTPMPEAEPIPSFGIRDPDHGFISRARVGPMT
jgi:hypothetical protein